MPSLFSAVAVAVTILAGQGGAGRPPAVRIVTVADGGADLSTRYLVGNLRVVRLRLQLPAAPGAPAAVLAEIDNRSRMPDTLVSATADGAGRLTVAPGPLAIGPDAKVDMSPDGPHVAVDGPSPSWKAGDTVPGVLVFERAGPLAVEFKVVAAADPAPAQP